MKIFFLIFTLLILTNCNKPKTVAICGDHICVNKLEAKQYFEENLKLEVKIINKQENKQIDLVQLNLNENYKTNRKISIDKKKKTSQEIKVLSPLEIKNIKKDINEKKNKVRNVKKSTQHKKNLKVKADENINKKQKKIKIQPKEKTLNSSIEVVDICTIIKKCNIEEISKYLIKQGKNKNYPDINTRERSL